MPCQPGEKPISRSIRKGKVLKASRELQNKRKALCKALKTDRLRLWFQSPLLPILPVPPLPLPLAQPLPRLLPLPAVPILAFSLNYTPINGLNP